MDPMVHKILDSSPKTDGGMRPALLASLALLLLAPAAVAVPATASASSGESTLAADIRILAATNATTTPTTTSTDDPLISGVAFFTTYTGPAERPVRIGFSAKPGAEGFFVLEDQNGTVLGTSDFQSFDNAIAADGFPIPFDEPVSGIRTVSVTAYHDTNGNQAFDEDVDEPYVDGNQRVGDTMTFLFPKTDGAVDRVDPSMVPATPGERAVHHYRLGVTADVVVHAIALDVRSTSIDAAAILDGSPTLKVAQDGKDRRIDPDETTTVLRGVALLRFDDPETIAPGNDAVLSVSDVINPDRPTNVSVVLNPYGSADAGTAHLVPSRTVPAIRSARLSADGSTVIVNAYFPSGEQAVVAVTRNHEVVARSQPIGGQPDMSVDGFGVSLPSAVEPGDSVTVELLRERDGEFADPYRWDGEPVATQVTRSAESTTTSPPPTETTTSMPGFGVPAILAALGALVLAFRHTHD